MATRFKYIDRGKVSLAVLIPGWATDHRIFDRLNIEYNYLVSAVVDPDDFIDVLKRNLEWSKATLIGWSLGGVLGAYFAAAYPDMVETSVLIGVREHYPAIEVEKMMAYLAENKRSYLKGFYRKCFSGNNASDRKWFNSFLLDKYLDGADTSVLAAGLNYLVQKPLCDSGLAESGTGVLFVRGENDVIAGESEMISLKEKFPRADFEELAGTGHAAFMDPGFRDLVNSYG